jgi:hypothetical protein
MELTSCLFLFLYSNVKIIKGIIEIMKLIVQEASEEIETCLLLIFAAALDGYVQELLGLNHLLTFHLVINKFSSHRVSVAPNNTDGI